MSTATFLCSVSSTVITSGCCFARTLRHAGQTPQPGSRSFYIRAPPPSEAPAFFVPSPPRRKEGSSARFSPAGSSPANAVSARHCQEMRQSPFRLPLPAPYKHQISNYIVYQHFRPSATVFSSFLCRAAARRCSSMSKNSKNIFVFAGQRRRNALTICPCLRYSMFRITIP